jgi:carbamate kinase
MRIVVALGGNALLRRGEAMTAQNQRENVRCAAQALAKIAQDNDLVISHGNGPQVGLLALQSVSYGGVPPFPLDVLDAQTEGMIGYMIEQELGNLLPFERPFATLLTMVEVDKNDPAFKKPTKPIGPVYTESEARRIADVMGWAIAPDGNGWRRVVPSPIPKRIFEIRPIRWLLEKNTVVICTGGGGIPTMYDEQGNLYGAEVVIDKDRASALLAGELDADLLIMATDVDGVYINWGTSRSQKLTSTTPAELKSLNFELGSMGPKVQAACDFVRRTQKRAAIGALTDVPLMYDGHSGTQVRPD